MLQFDLHALAAEYSKRTSIHKEIALAVAVGTASMAVGKRAYTRYYGDGQNIYPAVWMGIIAPKGSGKSPALSFYLRPLDKFIQTGDIKVIADVTDEARTIALSQHEMGLPCHIDELSGFLGSFGRYNNDKSVEIGHLLSIWSFQSYNYDRRSNDTSIYVREPVMPIVGGIQNGRFDEMLSKKDLISSGFLDRWLWSRPTNPALVRAMHTDLSDIAAEWAKLIDGLVKMPQTKFSLSKAALSALESEDETCARLYDALPDSSELKGTLAKRMQNIIRIALLLTVIDYIMNNATATITDGHVMQAIELVHSWSGATYDLLAKDEAPNMRGAAKMVYIKLLAQSHLKPDGTPNASQIAKIVNCSVAYASRILKGEETDTPTLSYSKEFLTLLCDMDALQTAADARHREISHIITALTLYDARQAERGQYEDYKAHFYNWLDAQKPIFWQNVQRTAGDTYASIYEQLVLPAYEDMPEAQRINAQKPDIFSPETWSEMLAYLI